MTDLPRIDADTARQLATSNRVCCRPLLRRVLDRQTGTEDVVPIPCGSTREAVCPSCAHRAKALRMQQCAEGWHLTEEPHRGDGSDDGDLDQDDDGDQAEEGEEQGGKRRRSCRRQQDVTKLPRARQDPRTVGQVFTTPTGKQFRPWLFLTVNLLSFDSVTPLGPPR